MCYIKKKMFSFITIPLMLIIGCIIGVIKSKNNFLFPAFESSFLFHLLLVEIICYFSTFFIIWIVDFLIHKKWSNIVFIVCISIINAICFVNAIINSDLKYYYSCTNDIYNYGLFDTKEIEKDIAIYFPSKNDIQSYNLDYYYFYNYAVGVDEHCEISLIVEYNNDYYEKKEELIARFSEVLLDNVIVVADYNDSRDHKYKKTIYFNDEERSITFYYKDSFDVNS